MSASKLCLTLSLLPLILVSTAIAGENEWTTNGPYGVSISSLVVDDLFDVIFAGSDTNGVYRSAYAGTTWVEINQGLTDLKVTSLTSVCPFGKNYCPFLYAGTSEGGIFLLQPASSVWEEINLGLTSLEILCLSSDRIWTVYAGTSDGIFRRYFGDTTWVDVYKPIYEPPNVPVWAIQVCGWTEDTVYAGGNNGLEQDFLIKTTNCGGDWNLVSTFIGLRCIAVDRRALKTIYVGDCCGVVNKSTDGGATWTSSHEGLPHKDILCLVVDPDSSNLVYAGTDGSGVYRSRDGGQTWSEMNTGLTAMKIAALATPQFTDKIYAGTNDGVFEYTMLTGVKNDYGSKGIPLRFELGQNYPNPFNSTTAISYQLSGVRPHHTTLRVYNILGQEVRTLVDDYREAGYYKICWDGRDNLGKEVSSGVYFYRLEVKGDRLKVIKTKKMILLR